MKTTVLYLDHTGKLGGAEFALGRLARSVDRSRVDPVFVFADEGPAPQLLRDCGAETHVIPLEGKVREVRKDTLKAIALVHPGRIARIFSYALEIARFSKERGVQVIHTNSLKAHIYGGLAGRISGVPVIWHIRDFIDESYLPQAAVAMVRFLARFIPSYVIAVSQSVMDKMRLAPNHQASTVVLNGVLPSTLRDNKKSAVVHDGLGDEELEDVAASGLPDTWPEAVRIGIVGRLAPWKGQHIFLQSAAKLLKAGHKAKFLVVGAPLFGEHDYEKELHAMVHTLGIAEHVEFLGFRTNIPEVLRNMEILVHASTSADPCPNTILEGMAQGLPVVGSNGGGVPELISDGETGLLVPMGDAHCLASALESLVSDPAWARQMGKAGYVRVRRHFTSMRVARQIEGVYREIVERGKTPAYRALEWFPRREVEPDGGVLEQAP